MKTDLEGIRIGYADEGKGAPVVLLHGFPFRREIWRSPMDALKGSRRVIAPDLCGFGESAPRPGAVPMDRFAGDVHALLQQLGTGPVALVGHSMGGYVALAFARRFPRMLRGLALVATRAGADAPEAAAARRATAEKVRAQGVGVVVEAMAPKMLSPASQDPALAERTRRFMAPLEPQGVIGALLGMADRPDATPGLAGISVPSLAITGADDVLIPAAESERMARAIRGARLEILPGAGHLVFLEQPEAFNRALNEWLDSCDATP